MRTFFPGSEWLYVKLYCSPNVADSLLSDLIKSKVNFFLENKLISKFFFIRYEDPEFHIRLRFFGDKYELMRKVWTSLFEELSIFIEDGRLWKIQFDTYVREIERYGGVHAIQVAEDVFFSDSNAVLKLLPIIRNESDVDLRWKLAMLGVNNIFDDFKISIDVRIELLHRLSSGLDVKFGNRLLKSEIGKKYRAISKELIYMIDESDIFLKKTNVYEIFSERSFKNNLSYIDLIELNKRGMIFEEVDSLVCSYIHMHINRIFSNDANKYEYVIYDFLFRLYKTKKIIKNNKNNNF